MKTNLTTATHLLRQCLPHLPESVIPGIRHDVSEFLSSKVDDRPKIVCLCGSTRFMEAFRAASLAETIAGNIILSIGCDTKNAADLMALGGFTEATKHKLDELHKRKIDLADEILVINFGGYIGESTRSEIGYAKAAAKTIRYLEPPAEQPAVPPFTLPPPPPGKQWHRTDGWTKDMLPPGTRPLLLGESREPGDEMMDSETWIRGNMPVAGGAAPDWRYHRTTRPLAFEHNGHTWTWHRLGDPMPCSPETQVAVLVICETGLLRASDEMAKYKNWGADTSIIGWRLAEPEKRIVPLSVDDIPLGSALMDMDGCLFLVTALADGRVCFALGNRLDPTALLEEGWQINRSMPRAGKWDDAAWEPCCKEVEP